MTPCSPGAYSPPSPTQSLAGARPARAAGCPPAQLVRLRDHIVAQAVKIRPGLAQKSAEAGSWFRVDTG